MPNRPPRLHWIFQSYDPPIYFITFNTHRRKRLLANVVVHNAFVEFARSGVERGIAVGRYVIMPDHVHLFVRGGPDFVLGQWVRVLKRKLSKAVTSRLPHWQSGFFDHLIRHSESYSEKWQYVCENPVRVGLVDAAEDWPWQGEIVTIAVI